MGLPVVHGGRSSSSRNVAEYLTQEEKSSGKAIVVNTNHDSSLSSTLTLLYPHDHCGDHGLKGVGDKEYLGEVQLQKGEVVGLFVELVIEISNMCGSTMVASNGGMASSLNTQARFRVPILLEQNDFDDEKRENIISPNVNFSSDGRYLVCLVPPPKTSTGKFFSSTTVIFNLRRLRLQPERRATLPAFSHSSNSSPSTNYPYEHPPTAIDPRIVRFHSPHLESTPCVTSICDAFTPCNNSSFLLLGCRDGSILAVNYKRARLAGVLYHPVETIIRSQNSPIICINHCSQPRPTHSNDETEMGSKSRLAVIKADGSVIIYTCSFVPAGRSTETKTNSNSNKVASIGLMIKLDPLATLHAGTHVPSAFFGHACWINMNLLAVSKRNYVDYVNKEDNASNLRDLFSIQAQVWFIGNEDGDVNKLSELTMDPDRLDAEMHGIFKPRQQQEIYQDHSVDKRKNNNDLKQQSCDVFAEKQNFSTNVSGIHFDLASGCLAVSGQVLVSNVASTLKLRPFVCIWDWNTNVLGLTLAAETKINGLSCFFSRLLFGQRGMSLFHFHLGGAHDNATTATKMSIGSKLWRDVYQTGLLSPSSTSNYSNSWVAEASSLLLSSNYVSFPLITQPISSMDATLDWKEFLIPNEYTTENGPPCIASIGTKMGRSIAVASSTGLCVLDMALMNNPLSFEKKYTADGMAVTKKFVSTCKETSLSSFDNNKSITGLCQRQKKHNHKWRMLANASEEKSFKVHAMVWWENNSQSTRDTESKEDISDDLLVAVIEILNEGNFSDSNKKKESRIPQFHIVCWSRRRLGLGENQLLESSSGEKALGTKRLGILLPNGLSPHFVSIIQAPSTKPVNNIERHRAILLISSNSSSIDGHCSYATYQLQTETIHGNKNSQRRVRGNLSSHGSIALVHTSSPLPPSPCANMFLVGGSFYFDLFKEMNDDCKNDFFATIGIIKQDGGLDSLQVNSFGPLYGSEVFNEGIRCNKYVDDKDMIKKSCLRGVVKYWNSDIIYNTTVAPTRADGHFVWTIALNDGSIFTWSVPYYCSATESRLFRGYDRCNLNPRDENSEDVKKEDDDAQVANDVVLFAHKLKWPLHPTSAVLPNFIHNDNSIFATQEKNHIPFFGTVSCLLGDSSLWMNGASSINRNEICLGPVPSFTFGCVLYSGQRCRNVRQRIPSLADSRTIEITVELFGISDCAIGAPAYTPSILSGILICAQQIMEKKIHYPRKMSEQQQDSNDSIALALNASFSDTMAMRRHALSRLEMNFGSNSTTALKVLILRHVEFLSGVFSLCGFNLTSNSSGEPYHALMEYAKKTLSEVILLAKDSLSPLQFSSLFLGIGRQIEPHHFDILFPLPVSMEVCDSVYAPNIIGFGSSWSSSEYNDMTVENLYEVSLRCGSIWIASSALPLFSSERDAHSKCICLLMHCLDSLGHSHIFCDAKQSNFSEEKHTIQQIFYYGMKLEEAIRSSQDYESYDSTSQRYATSSDSALERRSYGSYTTRSAASQISEDHDDRSHSSSEGEITVDGSHACSYDDKSSSESSENSYSESQSCNTSDQQDESETDEEYISESESHSSVQSYDSDEKESQPIPKFPSKTQRLKNIAGIISPRKWLSPRGANHINEKAIQDAASSFILSGFDNEKPTSGGISLSSDSTSVSSSQSSKENNSVVGIVGQYLIKTAFVRGDDDINWEKLGYISLLLMKDVDHFLENLTDNNISDLNRIFSESFSDVQNVLRVYNILEESKDFLCNQLQNQDSYILDKGRRFMTMYLTKCENCLMPVVAVEIFKLTIFVLLRHDDYKEVKSTRTPLAMFALITGHVTKSLHTLLGNSWETTSVGISYLLATKDMN